MDAKPNCTNSNCLQRVQRGKALLGWGHYWARFCNMDNCGPLRTSAKQIVVGDAVPVEPVSAGFPCLTGKISRNLRIWRLAGDLRPENLTLNHVVAPNSQRRLTGKSADESREASGRNRDLFPGNQGWRCRYPGFDCRYVGSHCCFPQCRC